MLTIIIYSISASLTLFYFTKNLILLAGLVWLHNYNVTKLALRIQASTRAQKLQLIEILVKPTELHNYVMYYILRDTSTQTDGQMHLELQMLSCSLLSANFCAKTIKKHLCISCYERIWGFYYMALYKCTRYY